MGENAHDSLHGPGGREWRRVRRELRVRESGSFVTRRRHGDVTSSLEGGKLFGPTSCLFFLFREGFDREGMIGCCWNRRRITSHLNPYTVCCVSYHFRTCNRFASDPDSTLSGLVPRSNHICRYCTGFWDTLSTGSLACRVLQYHASKGIHSSVVGDGVVRIRLDGIGGSWNLQVYLKVRLLGKHQCLNRCDLW